MYLYKYILTLHNRYINYNVKTIGLNYFFLTRKSTMCFNKKENLNKENTILN